jgi:tetratricopeptide (TPR) repeat protein
MKSSTIAVYLILVVFLTLFTVANCHAAATMSGPEDSYGQPGNNIVEIASMEAKRHMDGGRKLERERNLQGAIASYSKAASLAPESAEVHFALGEALAKAENFQEALVRYTLAVTIAPTHTKALYGRSQLCLRMALYGQAFKDLSQLIELMPGVADYHYQRATTLMKLKNITEAYHDYLRAHELNKKYPRPTLMWKKEFMASKSV